MPAGSVLASNLRPNLDRGREVVPSLLLVPVPPPRPGEAGLGRRTGGALTPRPASWLLLDLFCAWSENSTLKRRRQLGGRWNGVSLLDSSVGGASYQLILSSREPERARWGLLSVELPPMLPGPSHPRKDRLRTPAAIKARYLSPTSFPTRSFGFCKSSRATVIHRSSVDNAEKGSLSSPYGWTLRGGGGVLLGPGLFVTAGTGGDGEMSTSRDAGDTRSVQ